MLGQERKENGTLMKIAKTDPKILPRSAIPSRKPQQRNEDEGRKQSLPVSQRLTLRVEILRNRLFYFFVIED